MNKRAIIPLVIGLGVGVVALKIGLDVVRKAKGSRRDTAGVLVVVAKAPIDRESAIREEDVTTIESAEALVPDGSFSDPAAVIGRVSSVHLPKGMFLAESMLRPPGSKPGLEAAIPSGYRAVAVKVDEYVAVGNWLKPGARVDVLVVLNSGSGRRSQAMSRVVLRDVEVLAVGQVLDPTGKEGTVKGRSVTVLVREADAPKMHLASTKGKLRFALRGQDTANEEGGGRTVTDADLFGDGKPDKKEPSTPAAKGPSLLGSIFGGIARAGARASTPVTVVAPPPEPQTWTVELLDGSSGVETFEFAGPRSSRRLDRGVQARKARGAQTTGKQPAAARGAVRGRRPARGSDERKKPDDAARTDAEPPTDDARSDADQRFWEELMNAPGAKDEAEGKTEESSEEAPVEPVGEDDSVG